MGLSRVDGLAKCGPGRFPFPTAAAGIAAATYPWRFHLCRVSLDPTEKNVDRWDVLLMALAGYVAVMALIRLMAGHRNAIVRQLRQQMEAQQSRQPTGKDRKKRRGEAA